MSGCCQSHITTLFLASAGWAGRSGDEGESEMAEDGPVGNPAEAADPPRPSCPAEHRHHFQLSGAEGDRPVAGVALRCPDCAEPSAADELTEIVAARRRTIDGLAGLPTGLRADLAASGTLAEVYRGTVLDVHEAAERCGAELGVEPPGEPEPALERARATATLDAASEWLARHH
jgi:hypothetical protein